MNFLLKLEYVAIVILSILLFSMLPYAWWWFLVFFLVPDISILGYLVNPRVGSWLYNIAHTLTTGILLYSIGHLAHMPPVELAGTIFIGHAAMDRVFGFGLKYPDSFIHTHLGDM